jgi:hypothetical protein
MTGKAKKLEVRKLSDLVAFVLQGHYYDPLSAEDLADLAASIKRDGLRCPIEILPQNKAGFPPNTILSGHCRKAALELNGETTTKVLVRYDLANATKEEIEAAFHDDNKNRRQLDPLAKARVAVRLLELERKREGRTMQSGEARVRVGQALGMSGRNLDRHIRVLSTPLAVQNAFRAKRITLIDAGKIAGLVKSQQQEIAARLDAGEEPRRFLKEYLTGAATVSLSEYTSRFAAQSGRLKWVLTNAAAEGIDGGTLDKLDATCREMLTVIAGHRGGKRKK